MQSFSYMSKQVLKSKLIFSKKLWRMSSSGSSSSFEEISIPIPYGVIAGKAWGKKCGHPVIALHGWQDNAGTFDRLAPLLSPSLYVVAVDGIGSGLSSHKPHGVYHNVNEEFLDILRIARYFDWKKFSIIGHSLGGAIGLLFSSIFPEQVINVVLLDMLRPISMKSEFIPRILRDTIETLGGLDTKINSSPPVYSFKELKQRLVDAVYKEITPESAEILLKRGSRKSDCGKGFVSTGDIRVRYSDYTSKYSEEVLESYMKNLKCNLFILRCTNSTYKTRNEETTQRFFEIYKSCCKSFQLSEFHENHFVHLNNPEIVAPSINEFFETHLNGNESKL